MENSSQGLVMLDPEHKVVVTGEEHHQPALAGYAPRADGRARRVAVELRFTPAGRIEVLLDGWRVGELTKLMSTRYGRHVNSVLARGERPGAVGLVVDGRRGVEMELRLPDAGADDIVDATAPLPPVPRPTPSGPDAGRPPRGPRSRFRRPLLIGGAVFAGLIVVGSLVGGGDDERDGRTPTVAAAVPAVRPAPTTTPVAALDPEPTREPVRDVVAAPDPAETRAAAPRTTQSRVQPAPEPRRLVAPPPQPEPEPEPQPEQKEPEAVGAAYYPNCAAVRAAGADPIRAGDPGYSTDLDRDEDGIACE